MPRAHFDDNIEVPYSSSREQRHSSSMKRVSSSGIEQQPSKDLNMDEIFDPYRHMVTDDVTEFFDGSDDEEEVDVENPNRIFNDPKKSAVLDEGVHQIPGSPWAKPANKPSSRPSEPLPIASMASTIAFALAVGWVAFLFVMAVWNYSSVGRVIVEILLAVISFFGLFWNSYFTVSSIFKCFIPARAFRTNTKYCSMIPETKPPGEDWVECTIQIPVYKESLQEVMIPTLKSCIESRNYYQRTTGARCNICICDDGMMAMLKNNFAAAEMLWETIEATKGRVFKLSQLLQNVPRPSRRHLKGLSSRSVYEVFHRMLFYYHYDIGFISRSTYDRRGKFKKASNLNSHLRLVWGAEQIAESDKMTFDEALIQASHNPDGSRFTMFGGPVQIGSLIIVNDADARMAESVITKTVPEFMNDRFLGFTQHATKTLDDQRGESYYINMLATYTDALYQGHFLLSSILGCHPPLVGHSIFLRSEAIKQCGRIRTLRKTQRWLNNIGLPFLSIDQVGVANLNNNASTEYWSENHVSEDFELMIHFYNLGFNGRYVAYPDCEFQEGITRTFDEEAGRHRKFSLGAHELMFNPFNNWLGEGVFSPLFRTFLRSDIPSYYKIFLTAYLFSYTSGGAYIIVFTLAAIARLVDRQDEISYFSAFNSAGVLIMSILVYYIIGYTTFLIAMIRMRWANKTLLFPEYQNRGTLYLIYKMVRYCMFFQILFYSVMGNFFYLGSMDHLMSKSSIVSATNKDSIHIGRCTAFLDVIRFNSGSWFLSIYIILLSYAVWMEAVDWDYTMIPDVYDDQHLNAIIFAAPATFMALMAFIVPVILNPYVLGWPFNPPFCGCRKAPKPKSKTKMPPSSPGGLKSTPGGKVVDLHTFMRDSTDAVTKLEREAGRVQNRPDVELGSLATNDLGGKAYPISVANPEQSPMHARRSVPRSSGHGNYPAGRTRSDVPASTSNPQRNNSQQQRSGSRVKLAMI